MSDQNTSTPAQREVVQYLEKNKITDRLNLVVNDVCRAKSEDPFGLMITELKKYANPVTITRLVGREILDSRGNPTVEVDVYGKQYASEKLLARAGAPSGASTGSNEALELRDGDAKRYLGKGVTKAAANVTQQLTEAVRDLQVTKLRECDDAMCAKDGTQLKKTLGGNALTAASFAIAEAGATVLEIPLFQHLATQYWGDKMPPKFHLPRPMVNILNGGKHAGGNLKIQEFMIVPKAESFTETVRHMAEVYHHLGKILVKSYGVSAKNLGDEGGYAPLLENPDEALKLIESAIQAAGLTVGKDMFLALDAAASEFYSDGKYEVIKDEFKTSDEMVEFWVQLKKAHPALISIEDGLDEKDYDGWMKLTKRFTEEFKDEVMLVGDDLYTTNTDLIKQGVEHKWATALLLKVNQIGTISESMDAARMIYASHGNVIVSHRSGESTGSVISDLAVAIGAKFIKTGAPARGERVCKYNRLLQIEELLKASGRYKAQ